MIDIESTAVTLIDAMGYGYESNDKSLLTLCIENVKTSIKNGCNIEDVPEELSYVVAYRSAGEFLSIKLSIGADFTGVKIDDSDVKTVTEGDTTVTKFDSTSVSDRLRKKFADMKNYGVGEVVRFRCLKW